MYSIEFYEDVKGHCDMRDLISSLYETQKSDFYKIYAFLDHLEEMGEVGDKAVCRYPEGTIYMHCISGFEKVPEGGTAEAHSGRAGPAVSRKGDGKSMSAGQKNSGKDSVQESVLNSSHDPLTVCVILYGQYCEYEYCEDCFVLLHHYFTDRIPGGVPLLHLYQAVRELQTHRRLR